MKSRLMSLLDRRGSIAVMVAVASPALLAAGGLAVDVGVWYREATRLQLAADAAAMGAARLLTFGTASQSDYQAAGLLEANGVTSSSQWIGTLSTPIAVNVASDKSTITVTLTSIADSLLTRALGIPAPTLTATAMASSPMTFCMTALASSGTAPAISAKGAPAANMAGCNLMSNNDADCTGHNLGANIVAAHGSASGCGAVQKSGVPAVPDPYARLAANIPLNPCASYPQEPTNNTSSLPASNTWSGSKVLAGTNVVCGDLQLTSNVTVTASPSGVLVIENGQLDTNGYTLQTVSGSGLTIIFSGTSGAYTHAPTGGGTLDLAAPTSGTWSGIAIYQDPNLTSGVNISAAGNSPTWDITGLVYLPHSSVTFSGAVNKASNGASCFEMVADNITVSGTGSILESGGCTAAGLPLIATSPQLVM